MREGEGKEKRKFYRHGVWAPLRYVVLESGRTVDGLASADVGLMGLKFSGPEPLAKGALLKMSIALRGGEFEILSRVAWCRKVSDEKWETGVKLEEDVNDFKSSVLDQIFDIERFRLEHMRRTGKTLTFMEAAQVWAQSAESTPGSQST